MESSFQEKWNNHPLAGVQAVSDSLLFNSTGALGSREGLGGKPGGSGSSHEAVGERSVLLFPPSAGVQHPGCPRRDGSAASASGILGLGTVSAREAEPMPWPSPGPSLQKVCWWWLPLFVPHTRL